MDSRQLYPGLLLLLINVFSVESTFYLVNTYFNKMVELTAKNKPCTVYSDRGHIQRVLNKIDPKNLQSVNPTTLNELSISCQDETTINRTGGFVFPGTKWCGPGTLAKSYHDLGSNANEDRCCRDHDHCPNQLEPGQCRNGICNISPFTRSHCKCDEMFRECLQAVNSDVANIIGSIYFNVAQVTCFKERRDCTDSLRDNLSYSWFCDEWKFVPGSNYLAPYVGTLTDGGTNNLFREEPDKEDEQSRIDRELDEILDDNLNVMNNE